MIHAAAGSSLRLDAGIVDYLLIALYFVFVLGIGLVARRQVSNSVDFFLSGRSLPAWITGLAFISANLGATEIMGMSASGAQIGMATFHYYWIGAIPAMLFLAVVMMPFYYGSGVRSVPEFMRRRSGPATTWSTPSASRSPRSSSPASTSTCSRPSCTPCLAGASGSRRSSPR